MGATPSKPEEAPPALAIADAPASAGIASDPAGAALGGSTESLDLDFGSPDASKSPAPSGASEGAAAPASAGLPSPGKYDEISREAYVALHPPVFDGLRCDLMKQVSPFFSITHGIHMGHKHIETEGGGYVKKPAGAYQFGCSLAIPKPGAGTFSEPRLVLNAQRNSVGTVDGMVYWDVAEWCKLRYQANQFPPNKSDPLEPGYTHMLDVDLLGSDWKANVKTGAQHFTGVNYIQSLTPTLSMGGEWFLVGEGGEENLSKWSPMRSGMGLGVRHDNGVHVSTLQIATTGMLQASYHHKWTDKCCLAAEMQVS